MSSMLIRRNVAIAAVILAAAVSCAVLVSRAFAYNGPFCYGVYLAVYSNGCPSPQESNIRRAVGHGADWTYLTIHGGNRIQTSSCYSDGCEADTGYLPYDVTGYGGIANAGDPCNCGGGNYYGWLYP